MASPFKTRPIQRKFIKRWEELLDKLSLTTGVGYVDLGEEPTTELCVMQAIAYLTNQKQPPHKDSSYIEYIDHPVCVSPSIIQEMIIANDAIIVLKNRNRLKELIPYVMGTHWAKQTTTVEARAETARRNAICVEAGSHNCLWSYLTITNSESKATTKFIKIIKEVALIKANPALIKLELKEMGIK